LTPLFANFIFDFSPDLGLILFRFLLNPGLACFYLIGTQTEAALSERLQSGKRERERERERERKRKRKRKRERKRKRKKRD